MVRKIAILIPMFFLFLGLDNCKSPEAPKEPKYEFRYNVEVIYTSPPHHKYYVNLDYILINPGVDKPFSWDDGKEVGGGRMEFIGENKYRFYMPNVFVQTPEYPDKHEVFATDEYFKPIQNTGENIEIEGACALEIYEKNHAGFSYGTRLKFKMSK